VVVVASQHRDRRNGAQTTIVDQPDQDPMATTPVSISSGMIAVVTDSSAS